MTEYPERVLEYAREALARGNNNYGYIEIDADILRDLIELADRSAGKGI
jgi:hypothetical protein